MNSIVEVIDLYGEQTERLTNTEYSIEDYSKLKQTKKIFSEKISITLSMDEAKKLKHKLSVAIDKNNALQQVVDHSNAHISMYIWT